MKPVRPAILILAAIATLAALNQADAARCVRKRCPAAACQPVCREPATVAMKPAEPSGQAATQQITWEQAGGTEPRAAMVPIPEKLNEPTLAPPEPPEAERPGQVILVRVETDQAVLAEPLPPLMPVPEEQNEPTPASPDQADSERRGRVIVVQVEAEQGMPGTRDVPVEDGD